MRILYLDIDTLRADHLGCYGYPRATSPNIDRIAAEGVRLEQCYASDTPCLPSRTALLTGRFGIHNGVVGHGGTAADLRLEGASRGFFSRVGLGSFPARLQRAGLHTVTLSSFAQRHSAFHWHAGFAESNNVGKRGMERADEVNALALDWLRRNGERDNWFLHVHFWDPHTPYRTPESEGEPFAHDPLPAWLTEEVRQEHWSRAGPHSAQEAIGFSDPPPAWKHFPRQPAQIDSMDAVRRVFDGYDGGVLYADAHIGRLMNQLADLGVLEDTAILLSADHGETLGELGIYCDHQTADEHTAHVPFVIRWPGLPANAQRRVDRALHYQIDVAASVLELLDVRVPRSWDGRSFAAALREGRDEGREELVLSQGAWTCQRSLRFDRWLAMHSRHDGYHGFPEWMLFDLEADPHEQRDLAPSEPELVASARERLAAWESEMLAGAPPETDPLAIVIREGGPFHVQGQLAAYLERLRATGRGEWAERLRVAHPRESQARESQAAGAASPASADASR